MRGLAPLAVERTIRLVELGDQGGQFLVGVAVLLEQGPESIDDEQGAVDPVVEQLDSRPLNPGAMALAMTLIPEAREAARVPSTYPAIIGSMAISLRVGSSDELVWRTTHGV